MENYKNPDYEGNSPKYWTGKECIEKDCKESAGTVWSPHWCFKHNVERINKFGWKVIVYDSNDPFSEEIENDYEEDKIPYDIAVIRQIQYNLKNIIEDLSFINGILN